MNIYSTIQRIQIMEIHIHIGPHSIIGIILQISHTKININRMAFQIGVKHSMVHHLN